jgi:hypothetical protein
MKLYLKISFVFAFVGLVAGLFLETTVLSAVGVIVAVTSIIMILATCFFYIIDPQDEAAAIIYLITIPFSTFLFILLLFWIGLIPVYPLLIHFHLPESWYTRQ